VSTATSKASPPSIRLVSAPTVSFWTVTLWPVCFSNSGTSASTTCLNAPAVSTLISAAAAFPDAPAAIATAARPNKLILIASSILIGLGYSRLQGRDHCIQMRREFAAQPSAPRLPRSPPAGEFFAKFGPKKRDTPRRGWRFLSHCSDLDSQSVSPSHPIARETARHFGQKEENLLQRPTHRPQGPNWRAHYIGRQ